MKDAAALAQPAADDKRPQVETLLGDLFKLMGYPATLDFQNMADGSLGVAVHFQGEVPGIAGGKRSHLLDCVQFWLNKVVNRPNTPRRWVNLGANAFPAPRVTAPLPPAPQPSAPKAPPPKAAPKRQTGPVDERTLQPTPNPIFTALGQRLAEKSVKHGRLYGVMLLPTDARALMLRAAEGVPQVTVAAEGDGHWRRLVFKPEKLTPIAKKQVMPDWDEDDE